MNELANVNDRRMKLSEVAEALGYEPQALKYHVRELFPDLMRNGVPTYLNEEQVTAIKQKIPPVKVFTGAMTDLEAGIMAARVIGHYQARYEQEQRARIEAENNVARLESKIEADRHKTVMFDQCMESGSLMSISTMAKKFARLGLGPRKIFAFLRDRKIILRNHAGYWVPYQPYIDRGFFVVKQEPRRQGAKTVIDDITRVTQRGYAFVLEMVSEAYPLEATA